MNPKNKRKANMKSLKLIKSIKLDSHWLKNKKLCCFIHVYYIFDFGRENKYMWYD
jgi:hypothetical protein